MTGRLWHWTVATMLAVAVPVLLTVLATHAWAGQRVALVIGNGSYAHASSLANPLNDANDIGAALDRLGFSVTRLDNAFRAELWDGLQKFSLAASVSEIAVVFYAGHGIEVDKRNFLVPVDARLLSDAAARSVSRAATGSPPFHTSARTARARRRAASGVNTPWRPSVTRCVRPPARNRTT